MIFHAYIVQIYNRKGKPVYIFLELSVLLNNKTDISFFMLHGLILEVIVRFVDIQEHLLGIKLDIYEF